MPKNLSFINIYTITFATSITLFSCFRSKASEKSEIDSQETFCPNTSSALKNMTPSLFDLPDLCLEKIFSQIPAEESAKIAMKTKYIKKSRIFFPKFLWAAIKDLWPEKIVRSLVKLKDKNGPLTAGNIIEYHEDIFFVFDSIEKAPAIFNGNNFELKVADIKEVKTISQKIYSANSRNTSILGKWVVLKGPGRMEFFDPETLSVKHIQNLTLSLELSKVFNLSESEFIIAGKAQRNSSTVALFFYTYKDSKFKLEKQIVVNGSDFDSQWNVFQINGERLAFADGFSGALTIIKYVKSNHGLQISEAEAHPGERNEHDHVIPPVKKLEERGFYPRPIDPKFNLNKINLTSNIKLTPRYGYLVVEGEHAAYERERIIAPDFAQEGSLTIVKNRYVVYSRLNKIKVFDYWNTILNIAKNLKKCGECIEPEPSGGLCSIQ